MDVALAFRAGIGNRDFGEAMELLLLSQQEFEKTLDVAQKGTRCVFGERIAHSTGCDR
jgi:serine phosphatase RsbU (regulator of sigma subunit)